MNYIRLILSLDPCFGWEVHWMDVKNVFFMNIWLNKSIWSNPLVLGMDCTLVCRLKKSLYGLKQASRAWYEKIDHFLINIGFKWCEFDHSIYVLLVHGDTFIVAFYVDDLFIVGNNVDLLLCLTQQLIDTFKMTDLGLLHFFLGIQVL